MKFYLDHPEIDQVTMCTVMDCDPNIGFTIHLDEYDMDGFLELKELSNKKIRKSVSSFLKVGTQLPLSVIDVTHDEDNTRVVMSKKSVDKGSISLCKERFSLNLRLFGIGRRLSHMTDMTEDQWLDIFRSVMSPDQTESDHPLTVLSDRSKADQLADLEGFSHIVKHHPQLFGVKPFTTSFNFDIQSFAIDGMDRVVKALLDFRCRLENPESVFCHFRPEEKQMVYPNMPKYHTKAKDEWTDEEMYEDPSAVNVAILPIAIPTFRFQVTAYHKEDCDKMTQWMKEHLKIQGFDYLKIDP